jgi:hypothetical protein
MQNTNNHIHLDTEAFNLRLSKRITAQTEIEMENPNVEKQ